MPSVASMHGGMAHQHSSKPATKAQKVMSKRHKTIRKMVEKMPEGSKKQAMQQKYDLGHGVDHGKNLSAEGQAKLVKKMDKIKVKILKK